MKDSYFVVKYNIKKLDKNKECFSYQVARYGSAPEDSR